MLKEKINISHIGVSVKTGKVLLLVEFEDDTDPLMIRMSSAYAKLLADQLISCSDYIEEIQC